MSISTDVERPGTRNLADEGYENIRVQNDSVERYGGWSLSGLLRNRESFEALRFDGMSVDEIIRDL